MMRLFNRLLAALLSLALIVAGVLMVVEVAAQRLGRRPAVLDWPRLHDWAKRTPWQQGSVRVACVLLVILGVLLLIAELTPSRPSRLAVRSSATDGSGATGGTSATGGSGATGGTSATGGSGATDTAYTRRGVAAALRAAVSEVDGIDSASVSVGRRKVKVTASTAGLEPHTAESLREPATAAARRRLDALELQAPPALSVTVSTAGPAAVRSR